MDIQQTRQDHPNLPPMLVQYLDYKEKYSDCKILFQVGDFYEAFFEDAEEISGTLNLTLTSRDKKAEKPIPMCGVPLAVIDNYLDRLVEQNFSVAVVSQDGVPGKGMVPRKLERIVTPGVQVLGNSEQANDSIVAALYPKVTASGEISKNDLTLAYCYPASGEMLVLENLDEVQLETRFSQILPRELILPNLSGGKNFDARNYIIKRLQTNSKDLVIKFKNHQSPDKQERRDYAALSGYSSLGHAGKSACQLLTSYLDELSPDICLPIHQIKISESVNSVIIDANTRTNLDILINARTANLEGSLFAYLDLTLTAGGRRLLKNWLLNPVKDPAELEMRYNSIEIYLAKDAELAECQEIFNFVADLERLAARIELNVITPPEAAIIRDSLLKLSKLETVLKKLAHQGTSRNYLSIIAEDFAFPLELLGLLADSLAESPVAAGRNQISRIFTSGYNQNLDRYRNLAENGQSLINELAQKYQKETGISSLKIKFNNVIGYFIEVTQVNSSKIPETYRPRQSTANYSRYDTPELKDLEKELTAAEGEIIRLEKELYQELKLKMSAHAARLKSCYAQVALLDVLQAFSELTKNQQLVRPEIGPEIVSDAVAEKSDSLLLIEEGRHPILEKILKNDLVANSLNLNSKSPCMIITGPNMGGKSTYLRQTALITIMAQVGCYVPAKSLKFTPVDRIYARIGASDNQLEGDSTFMLEMREAAEIINTATEQSLVLIDELGRGTSTVDGLAIARAVLEWLIVETKARTLFATHFHQLTELEKTYPSVRNFSVASLELDGQVLFTHEIKQGAANQSYGLEVAVMAGLPDSLISRAEEIISSARSSNQEQAPGRQLGLFVGKGPEKKLKESAVNKFLSELDVDGLSPREALEKLYQLKELNSEDS